jgi:hypothetical protein
MVRHPATDVRPGFVSGAGSRRPLMAETRVMGNTNPAEKRIPVFGDASGKTQYAENTLGVFMDRLSRGISI